MMNMKRLCLFPTFMLVFCGFFHLEAQEGSLGGFKYQAVARDGSGVLLANKSMGIQLSIVDEDGTEYYSETHHVTTSDLAIFSINVGIGETSSGSLKDIPWGKGMLNLKVAVDPTNSGEYTVVGMSPILGVPYALYAANAGSVNTDEDPDPTNELQSLVVDGDQVYLSGDTIGTILNISQIIEEYNQTIAGDWDTLNEIQTLILTDSLLSLSKGGGSVVLRFERIVGNIDTSFSNEIQTLTKSGNQIELSKGGGSVEDEVNDADADPVNELQNLTQSGDTIFLSGGGGMVILGDRDADSGNELQTLSKNGNQIMLSQGGGTVIDEVNDGDTSGTNELQTISQNGNDITLSNGGGTVTVTEGDADPTNEIQTLAKNGDQIILSKGGKSVTDRYEDDDADPTNEIQTLSKNGDNVSLSQGGGTVSIEDDDANPQNELQTLSLNGNTLNISNGNSVNLNSISDGDSDPTNELQTLSVNNNSISISGGNTVNLPSYWVFEPGDPIEGIPDEIDADYQIKAPALQIEGGPTIKSTGIQSTDAITIFNNSYYVKTNNSQNRIRQWISSGAGVAVYYGPNNNQNVVIKGNSGNRNNGQVSVYDQNNSIQASLYVNTSNQGVVTADVKNFHMDHPELSEHQIWYASLEGPEAAAYARGQIKIVNGEVSVVFPDHFVQVANTKGMTIVLTPHSADSKGLAAIERTSKGFKIKELFQGQGNYMVDWEVKSIRKGFEDYQVIRKKEK